ncbi:cardiolipin synthase [Candidatus Kaiserbacteria bacterium]|nr:cardiolipin synthase [Candidatus Kaiserbacteria bacterium]
MQWVPLIVHIFVIIPFTVRILLRDDISAPARLAWFMVITLFPYVGAAIYFLFGEARFGAAIQTARIETANRTLQVGKKWLGTESAMAATLPVEAKPLASYAASVDGMAPVAGNLAELLADEETAIDRIVTDITTAKHHVHILYYIWETDETGQRMVEAVVAAAKRGVRCRVMVDGLGSRRFINSPLWQKLQTTPNVTAQVAMSLKHIVRTTLFSRVDLRNHRKITIVDNLITYCGSQNCADKAFHAKPKYAPWVDIMFRVSGPVVTQNQLLFASDWLYYHPEDELTEFLTPEPVEAADGFPAQIVGFGPTTRAGASSQLLTTLIGNARERLTITTPYFVPDMEILSSLEAAAHRGVAVALVVPARNDSWVVAAASRSYYRRLLEAGILLYEYTPGLLHAKTLTVDGLVTFVGSTNLDLRSFDLNFENNIIMYDTAIANETYARQLTYLNDSEPVTLSTIDAWTIPERLWHNAVATIGPIL